MRLIESQGCLRLCVGVFLYKHSEDGTVCGGQTKGLDGQQEENFEEAKQKPRLSASDGHGRAPVL